MNKDRKVLYSGMQATGNLTLGNYLGALKNWVNLADEYECFYGVMDLHSLTVRQNPAQFRAHARELMMLYIAAGIDPEKNCLYSNTAGIKNISLKSANICWKMRKKTSNRAM